MSKDGIRKLVSSARMPDSKNVTNASKPFSISRQKKSSFVKIGNPPKFGKSGSVHSDIYSPTSDSLVATCIIIQNLSLVKGSADVQQAVGALMIPGLLLLLFRRHRYRVGLRRR